MSPEQTRRPRKPAGSALRVDWPRVLNSACRLIESDALRLADLAALLKVGRSELQRQFTRRLGISPRAYAQALALHRLASGAATGRNVLDAVLDAGFGTSSTAYAATAGTLGVTPGAL